jgi:hypothetical protein
MYFMGCGPLMEQRKPFAILRTETLKSDLEAMFTRMGLGPDEQVKMNSGPINVGSNASELTRMAKNNLRRWFHADILFFEYCHRMADSINQSVSGSR